MRVSIQVTVNIWSQTGIATDEALIDLAEASQIPPLDSDYDENESEGQTASTEQPRVDSEP